MNPVSSNNIPYNHPVQSGKKADTKTNENSNLIGKISKFASSLFPTSNSYESDPRNKADQKVLAEAKKMLDDKTRSKIIRPKGLNSPSKGDSNVATTRKATIIATNIFTRNTNTNPAFDDNRWSL